MREFIVASLFTIGGFLLWNFPAAKIFMGDAGSAFLGFFFGVLILLSIISSGPALTTWLLLLGIFIIDASYTLAVRVVTGQKWHQAHRTHAYQRLNQLLNSHPKTVAVLMGVNVVWLLPWAWALQHHWLLAPAALFGAYLPLVAACYALKAGIPLKAGV
jgi:Fuc2NAc and GlcNAc transferase